MKIKFINSYTMSFPQLPLETFQLAVVFLLDFGVHLSLFNMGIRLLKIIHNRSRILLSHFCSILHGGGGVGLGGGGG